MYFYFSAKTQNPTEAARRVEEVNQSRSNYERQLAEYQQRMTDREYQITQVKQRIQEIDNAIVDLAQVRAVYSGTVRRIKLLGQSPDGSLNAEITLISKDN